MTASLQLDRRILLKSLLLTSSAALCGAVLAQSAIGAPLPLWREGELDLHHIDTGRGNCTFLIAPDATTMMIDAGAGNAAPETSSKTRPSSDRRAGEWQARYALRHSPSDQLDYFIATHIHPDHVGDVSAQTPLSSNASFHLTGVSDIDRLMPIATLIDRGYPAYGDAPVPDALFAANYLAYLKSRVDTGRVVKAAAVGSDRQVHLRNPAAYPSFKTRILAADGRVWRQPQRALPTGQRLNENIYSVALRIEYGRFSYFTGGDLSFDTQDGREPALDIETPTVHACGRTEVAAADHHGYFDACGPAFVNTLDAQAYIIQAWDIGHPGSAQMQRMLGAWSDRPGKPMHDVFATGLLPANELMNRRFAPMLKSKQGHIIVRVAKGGDTYRIFTVDSTREEGNVTGSFGPYTCRA